MSNFIPAKRKAHRSTGRCVLALVVLCVACGGKANGKDSSDHRRVSDLTPEERDALCERFKRAQDAIVPDDADLERAACSNQAVSSLFVNSGKLDPVECARERDDCLAQFDGPVRDTFTGVACATDECMATVAEVEACAAARRKVDADFFRSYLSVTCSADLATVIGIPPPEDRPLAECKDLPTDCR